MSPNANYRAGAQLERDVANKLSADGYDLTIRSAGSKGKVDVVAFKAGQILFVQAKRTGVISPADRADLIRIARIVGALPLVATRPGVTLRLLTGAGPKDWEPWSPDIPELP